MPSAPTWPHRLPAPVRRLLGERWDVVVAAALLVLAFVPGIDRQGLDVAELPDRPPDALGVVLTIALAAPVAVLRRRPAVCLAVVGAAFCAHQLLGYPTTVAALAVLVSLAGAGALLERGRRTAIGVAVAVYVLLAVALALVGSPSTPADFVLAGLVLAVVWIAGTALRAWSDAEAERRRRAERDVVAAERARIARELHDVVTHHVTAVVVQSEAAQYGTADADRTARTLERIGETGRLALADLRYLLGALDGSPDEPRGPAGEQTGVAELVERARAAGQQVDLVEDGEPRPLTGAAGVAVARVVQEGLTNALKHAAGAPTTVLIRYRTGDVDVEIRNGPGRASIGRGGGRGLVGLRERVAVVGGELEAGPVGDGFGVRARVPA